MAKRVKKPFVFSFMIPEGGHSVVVCGYKKDTDGNHEITIYDEKFITLEVTGDT